MLRRILDGALIGLAAVIAGWLFGSIIATPVLLQKILDVLKKEED